MRKTIAIDMDETLCDTLSRHLDWYNGEFGQALTKAELQGIKIYDKVLPEHRQRVREYPDMPGFFADLAPLENALEVVRELHQDFDILIATAAMEHPTSFTPKFNWLREHLPFLSPLNFIFCGPKKVVQADYLIDDSARHFEGFVGRGVLFTAPHNVNEQAPLRVDNWLQVREFFAKAQRV